jgi:hypothetical protein
MEKRIIAFSYIVLKLAEQYAKNVIQVNDKKNPNDFSIKDKLYYFNFSNDFSKLKCSLFPFLVTVANSDKKDLNNFFGGFLPLNDGFLQYNLYESINEESDNIFEKLFRFSEDFTSLEINKSYIDTLNENRLTIAGIKNALYQEEIDLNNIPVPCIDNSINHINTIVEYFPNRNASFLAYLSKDNIPYRRYSFLFDSKGKIKQDYSHIVTVEQVSELIRSYIDGPYKFPLTPAETETIAKSDVIAQSQPAE